MPRRLPIRPAKIVGNLFVLFVIGVISTIYYTYVFLIWGPRCVGNLNYDLTIFLENPFAMLLLAFFHLFFIMLVWSFA